MTVFNITNSGTANGGPGDDTLKLTYSAFTDGVWLLSPTVNPAGGYDGAFNGFGGNDTIFTGIENFGSPTCQVATTSFGPATGTMF